MNVTRLSLARILELRVPMTWRDAGAVLVEGVYRAQELGGTSLDPIAPDTVLVTRGGEVVLTGDAERAHPEAVAALADDLLRGCEDRGDLGDAIASGDLLPFLESLSHDTSWKRRRVEIATLALRGIAAHADQLRSMIRARSAATADAAAGRSRREPRRAAGDHGFGATVDRHRESATGSSARRVSARAVIWTVVAISATAAGLSVWLADTGPFAPSPTTQGPVGRR